MAEIDVGYTKIYHIKLELSKNELIKLINLFHKGLDFNDKLYDKIFQELQAITR